ncbi:MAG: hypothetical protein ACPG4X_16425 [Pikeienuella sp.]
MSREDESLPEKHLSDPTSRLDRGVDHDGNAQWYISTREGWQEAGTREGMIIMDPDHFPLGSVLELREPIPEEHRK